MISTLPDKRFQRTFLLLLRSSKPAVKRVCYSVKREEVKRKEPAPLLHPLFIR